MKLRASTLPSRTRRASQHASPDMPQGAAPRSVTSRGPGLLRFQRARLQVGQGGQPACIVLQNELCGYEAVKVADEVEATEIHIINVTLLIRSMLIETY